MAVGLAVTGLVACRAVEDMSASLSNFDVIMSYRSRNRYFKGRCILRLHAGE